MSTPKRARPQLPAEIEVIQRRALPTKEGQEEDIGYAALHAPAQRLFAPRRSQPWPPSVVAYERWDTLCAEAADGLDVIEHVDDAVAWANDFITRAVQ
ncbi:MAG: hypothetical protein HYX32_14755 [Actinobacteria bacterium]|nr:hypothetical protein [Actinomycetota bacterium]